MEFKKVNAFTLVELIVVITILAVLSTIGFVSYSGYLAGTRDTNRISQIKSISEGLNLYSTNHSLPSPEDKVDVEFESKVIAYQGYVGKSVLETITYSTEGVDPKDKTYFSYYLSKDKKHFQLMAFLEEEENIQTTGTFGEINAVDYSIRYPIVFGKKLGILTDEFNTPIQEISSIKTAKKIELDLTNSGTLYKAYIDNGSILEDKGKYLAGILQSIIIGGAYYGAPSDCPKGFISVPGNSNLGQVGFCVSKYEITYADATTPNSCHEHYPTTCLASYDEFNTVRYIDGKKIISHAGTYPIGNITQSEAIKACKSMGKNYHLLTNNEWMTIARNIEDISKNWSSGKVLNGGIYQGITTETNSMTSLGCDIVDSDGLYSRSKLVGALSTDTSLWGSSKGDDCDSKRQLMLSNGEIIWDLGGNLFEHVNKANTVYGSLYNDGQTVINGSSSQDDWDDDGLYLDTDMDKYASKYKLGISNGMGSIFYSQGKADNVFIRGGIDNALTNGIFALSLVANSTFQSRFVGFRCAYIK